MIPFNVYCDESCHLEHDRQPAMVLGAIVCPRERTRGIAQELRELKAAHGLPPEFEVKWNKVSPAKTAFYVALVDFFFDQTDLRFRALVVPDKTQLDHGRFSQSHDDFYYKMFFEMLRPLLADPGIFSIYLDVKDSRSVQKTRKLHEILCNELRDFQRERVAKIEMVRSDQIQQVQLADLLIGATSYANRRRSGNAGKIAVIDRIEQLGGRSLTRTSPLTARKLNVFIWRPAEAK